MIPIELQDYLNKEITDLLMHFKVNNANNEPTTFNIYSQAIPIKQGKKDRDQYPSIIISIENGSELNEDGVSNAEISFLIGIYDENEDNQGYRDVINTGNKIINYLLSNNIFDNKHSLERPLTYQLPDEDTSPYFFLSINTTWNVPQITMKDDKYT